MQGPAQSLYEALRVLERRAVAARQKAGLPPSRREAAAATRRAPYHVEVDARRISSWCLSQDPSSAQVPRTRDADKVWALVRVWSDWAGDRSPRQRYWMDLIEAAQPARVRKATEDSTVRLDVSAASRPDRTARAYLAGKRSWQSWSRSA